MKQVVAHKLAMNRNADAIAVISEDSVIEHWSIATLVTMLD